jgi:hypothetical protein
LTTRNAGADLAAQHERALAMRWRRFEHERGGYEDLIDIARHQATSATTTTSPRSRPKPSAPCRAPWPPSSTSPKCGRSSRPAQRAWMIVAEQEVQAFLDAGDLPAAGRQLHAIHQQAQARAAADPANTQWQRDLSVSHEKLDDLAVAAGDLATPAPPTRPPSTSPPGWPPPTPPTPNGSKTRSVSGRRIADLE